MTTEQRLPLSVCMIAATKRTAFRRALESVAGWTSEIIVVINDDVSDGTTKSSRDSVRKFSRPWKGFKAQKIRRRKRPTRPGFWPGRGTRSSPRNCAKKYSARSPTSGNLSTLLPFSFPACAGIAGVGFGHGDWYPDRQTRLWRRDAQHGRHRPAIQVAGGGLHRLPGSNLHHYSRESINEHLEKIIPFSDEFVEAARRPGRLPGAFDLALRPLWRFVRAYICGLGFLDGWPGYYIACHTAFSTVVRYAKLREARSRGASINEN